MKWVVALDHTYSMTEYTYYLLHITQQWKKWVLHVVLLSSTFWANLRLDEDTPRVSRTLRKHLGKVYRTQDVAARVAHIDLSSYDRTVFSNCAGTVSD